MFNVVLTVLLSFMYRMHCREVEHTSIGVIEHVNPSEQNAENQQDLLRRRLMGGSFSSSDKASILLTHNRCRNATAQGSTYGQPSALNMNQLFWDAGLAKVAQSYSSKCTWAHNSNRNTDLLNYLNETSFDYTNRQVGENLFLTTGSETLSVILQGIQYWYEEYTYYTYGTVSGTSSCQSGQQCGHYTQLVWGNTRYVGCGYTKCSMGVFLVCNYYFPGNIVGYYPYTSGSPASSCPSDRIGSGGLCSYCPSSKWDTYCCEYCSSTTCANAKAQNLLNSPQSCTDGLSNSYSQPSQAVYSSDTSTTTTTTTTTRSPTTTTASPTTTRSPTTTTATTRSPTTASTTTTTRSPTTTTTTRSPTTTTTTRSPTTTTTTRSPTTTTTTRSPTTTTTTRSPTTTTTTRSPTTAPPTTTTTTTRSPTTAPPTTTTTRSPTTAATTTTTTRSPTTTTRSPTTTTTTRSPTTTTTTTRSPTTTTSTTTTSAGSSICCLPFDSRYSNFCSSVSSTSTLCAGYSSVCYWSC